MEGFFGYCITPVEERRPTQVGPLGTRLMQSRRQREKKGELTLQIYYLREVFKNSTS